MLLPFSKLSQVGSNTVVAWSWLEGSEPASYLFRKGRIHVYETKRSLVKDSVTRTGLTISVVALRARSFESP